MLGAAWPIQPILGQVFRGFAYNGRSWVQSRGAEWTNVQVFTTSGRYTPSEDLLYAIVECIGPGGGGGWATGDLDGVQMYATAAGGGGSGGYSRKTLPGELLVQGADVALGLGGLVGLGTIGGGMTAGTTSFGGLCVANGGYDSQAFDGSGIVSGAHGTPGAGAALGVGDVVMPGAAGEMWRTTNVNIAVQHLVGAVGGLGGQLFGGALWPVPPWMYTNQNGMDGLANSGAGGGGAQVNIGSTGTTMFGGRGGSGLCVVTEICGTEGNGGGGPGPIEPPTGWPPGVPFNVNLKARVVYDPNGPHVEPVK